MAPREQDGWVVRTATQPKQMPEQFHGDSPGEVISSPVQNNILQKGTHPVGEKLTERGRRSEAGLNKTSRMTSEPTRKAGRA